jgi:hypothetical protein
LHIDLLHFDKAQSSPTGDVPNGQKDVNLSYL